MIALPSIFMLVLLASLTLAASATLRRAWQRKIALGFAALELAMAAGFVALILHAYPVNTHKR